MYIIHIQYNTVQCSTVHIYTVDVSCFNRSSFLSCYYFIILLLLFLLLYTVDVSCFNRSSFLSCVLLLQSSLLFLYCKCTEVALVEAVCLYETSLRQIFGVL